MALSLALPLSGLEPNSFGALEARLLCEPSLRNLNAATPSESMSPRSWTSESSGIASLPLETPSSSRSNTPQSTSNAEEKDEVMRIVYENRDILNLGANIREPSWQLKTPVMPRYDVKAFMAHRSLYYRLGNYGLIQEYQMNSCQECGFKEPTR